MCFAAAELLSLLWQSRQNKELKFYKYKQTTDKNNRQ